MAIFGFDVAYSVRGVEDKLALQRLSVAFERAGDNFSQFGQYAFPLLIPVLEKALGAQFSKEGQGPNRGTWKALSPKYAEWKRKHYPGKPILEASGKLKAGLTSEGSPFAQRAYSASMLSFGTSNVHYASFHQTGTAHMPDRPPFDFGAGVEAQVRAAAMRGARAAIAAANLDAFTRLTGTEGGGE